MKSKLLWLLATLFLCAQDGFAQGGLPLPAAAASELTAKQQQQVALKHAVQDALNKAGVPGAHVRVKGQTVILSGRVASQNLAQLASSTAGLVAGVSSVDNLLKVRR